MAFVAGNRNQRVRRAIRAALIGPQLAAFIPALSLGAYWYGGEGLLLFIALIFPALLALTGILTRPASAPDHTADPVSGLPMRSSVMRALNESGATGSEPDKMCLAIEIDNVDVLRERYGHGAVERILREISNRLCEMMRPTDLIASLGTGRFAVVISKTPRVDLEVMIQLSARLQGVIGAPLSIDEARVLVTACVGFCLPSRVPEQTGEAYLSAAESALEEAKRSGPGSVRAYTQDMRARVATLDLATREVVKALESGQILPWFQPQISTDTGKLTGFEALARWIHPDKGLIAPAAFLPSVSRAGLFERLGEVILFKSLSALREWDRAGLTVPSVAVNLSAEELRNPKLFDKIRWELDRFEITPDRLVLEILENVVAQSDDDTATRNIAALSGLGCGIDLDDFGTGHASIANIRRFDVNRIKIDRSFITHVDTDRDQQNMVAAILTMAERLEVDTLAEGVESIGEHSMLAQLGCGHVQGYSIGKPMPFEETGGWIVAQREKRAKAPSLKRPA